MTVREKLGQLLMFGFPGMEPDDDTETLIEEYKAGNIIIFSHNIENAVQLKALCGMLREKIQRATGVSPILSIDQEGGVVARLPGELASFPSAMAVAATKATENAYLAAYDTGRELAALGMNCNLAPVADLNTNKDNPVIGVRSYGKSPEEAAPFILSVIRGQEDAGILSVAKHFPGHGDTVVDSHLGLPCIRKRLEELQECELIPFRRAIEQGVPAIMAAHILYPALDDTGVPASMSEKILRGLLRGKLGFEGLILSDCMEMKAIQDHYGTPEGFVRAIIAGVDLGCISHSPAMALRALQLAERAVETGELSMERLNEAAARVLSCKRRLAAAARRAGASEEVRRTSPPEKRGTQSAGMESASGTAKPEAPESGEVFAEAGRYRAEAQSIMNKAVVLLDGGSLPVVNGETFFVGCPAYRSTFASEVREDEETFPRAMAEYFGGDCLITPVNPKDMDVELALSRTREGQTVVVGTYNAHLNRGQLALVNGLCDAGRRVVAVALRNPYDLSLIREEACKIAAFEYTPLSFGAVRRVLEGAPAEGGICW